MSTSRSGYCVNLPLLGSSGAAAAEPSARLQNIKIESPADTEAIKQNEEIHSKRTVPKEAWTEDQESLQIDIAGNEIVAGELRGGRGGVTENERETEPVSVCFHFILIILPHDLNRDPFFLFFSFFSFFSFSFFLFFFFFFFFCFLMKITSVLCVLDVYIDL